MKFWNDLITYLKRILDKNTALYRNSNEISIQVQNLKNQIQSLKDLVVKDYFSSNDLSNEEPIKVVKTSPLLLLNFNRDREKLIIQNIGLEPCYIKLSEGVSNKDYHFVLAPDTSLNFGNGGNIALDKWHGEVYAVCEKETKISVLEY